MNADVDAARALEEWADQVDPTQLRAPGPLALELLAAGVEQRDTAERLIVEAVRKARVQGQTWSQIAAVLGVTKQAAQRKFAPRLSA